MKIRILTIALIGINFTLNAQSISISGNRYHYYGPNTSWGGYLKVGGNGRQTTEASVVTTNGNLHIDSKNGHGTYINQYSKGNIVLNPQGGNVGIGTANPGIWKLAVNGDIRAKKIKVEAGWSDFVFYKDYELPSLLEVENFIKENGHLKDIPSAMEVEKNGIFLGEMSSKLLQKIEELTLYTIEQEKKIEQVEKENESLKFLATKVLELQKRLDKLEKE